MSVSELEQAQLVQSERQMAIMIDFEEIVKHEVRIVLKNGGKLYEKTNHKFSDKFYYGSQFGC